MKYGLTKPKLSAPLDEPPAFLSTISMTVDDQSEIVKGLRNAEIPTPAFYRPARDLFIRILCGDLSFDHAIRQADKITEPTDRKCAVDILSASKDFLTSQPKSTVKKLARNFVSLPKGLRLAVSPIWFRFEQPKRVLVLYFWNTALSPRQISAAAAVVRQVINYEPGYSDAELDFVSIALNSSGQRREFRHLNWAQCKPLNDDDLARFWKLFIDAWEKYRQMPAREIKRKRDPGFL